MLGTYGHILTKYKVSMSNPVARRDMHNDPNNDDANNDDDA